MAGISKYPMSEAFSRLTEICCRIIASLPQSKVVVEPFLVRCDAVGIKELGGPVALVVVPQRPCGDRQVGPAVSDAEVPEVDVPAVPTVVVDQGVRCTRVALAHHEPV